MNLGIGQIAGIAEALKLRLLLVDRSRWVDDEGKPYVHRRFLSGRRRHTEIPCSQKSGEHCVDHSGPAAKTSTSTSISDWASAEINNKVEVGL